MQRSVGQGREAFTWVRTQGKGRMFYTGYGHEPATWSNPNFQKLIEQAIVWGVDEPARRAYLEMKMPEVTYVDTFVVPNYEQPQPGAEVSDAVHGRRLDEVHPGAGRVQARAVREGAGHHRADRLQLRRARPAVDHRGDQLPERGAERQSRRRPHQDRRGHQRRRPRRQVHGVRGPSQSADQPGLRQRRRDRDRGAAHAVPEGHQRRRQGGREADPQHRMGHRRHARRARRA